MNQDYTSLANAIKSRRNPESLNEGFDARTFSKSIQNRGIGAILYDDVEDFIHESMKSVGKEYTAQTVDAGSMVKQHLQTGLTDVEYRYQGSVMTNTHIKGYSDIDLVCISDKSYRFALQEINNILGDYTERNRYSQTSINKLEAEKAVSSYQGNSVEDLRTVRNGSEKILSGKYDICDVDHPKAVKITNKSLRRDVDIVTAGWYDDVTSIINGRGAYRGIQVYNKSTHSKESADFPFISIDRINERGTLTDQRLKKMIRFLKNVRSLSDLNIDLSSFVINAICYNIPVHNYGQASENQLIEVLNAELYKISTLRDYADTIVSVDGHEFVYKYNTKSWNETKKLYTEIAKISLDLVNSVAI